jgi:hypothetical protein
MGKQNYPMLTTIGIEYEVEDISPNIKLEGQMPKLLNTTHDASIEDDRRYILSSVFLKKSPDELSGVMHPSGKQSGIEIVSVPLDVEEVDVLGLLKDLTSWLQLNGESQQSNRAGVHFHVSMPVSLRVCKSILRLGRHMEDVFFYIGGQGYPYRGQMLNDNAYCRPITKMGPPCVDVAAADRKKIYGAQCFNVSEMLDATTINDFFWRYGGLVINGSDFGRYFPNRYTWLNLYSLSYHGTLEFRVFNKTLNPFYLNAEIELCRLFCEYAIKFAYDDIKEDGFLTEHSIYDKREKADIKYTLKKFADKMHMNLDSLNTLSTIIDRTPEVTLDKSYIWTHVPQYRHGEGHTLWNRGSFELAPSQIKYFPKEIPSKDIKVPKIVDIHSIRNENGTQRTPQGLFRTSVPREQMESYRAELQRRARTSDGPELTWSNPVEAIPQVEVGPITYTPVYSTTVTQGTDIHAFVPDIGMEISLPVPSNTIIAPIEDPYISNSPRWDDRENGILSHIPNPALNDYPLGLCFEQSRWHPFQRRLRVPVQAITIGDYYVARWFGRGSHNYYIINIPTIQKIYLVEEETFLRLEVYYEMHDHLPIGRFLMDPLGISIFQWNSSDEELENETEYQSRD